MHMTARTIPYRTESPDTMGQRMLFDLIKRLFPGEQIIRHHQPRWLKRQDLPIYLPYSRIAFEYHGVDHFREVANGGEARRMEEIRRKDHRKVLECHRHGVLLIAIPDTEPMTISHIRDRIQREGCVAPSSWVSLVA